MQRRDVGVDDVGDEVGRHAAHGAEQVAGELGRRRALLFAAELLQLL